MSSQPSRFATRVVSLVAALVVVSACKGRTGPQGGGQTGDGSDFQPAYPLGESDIALACDFKRTVLTDLAADTDLGFSPNDVLDFAVGELTSTLAWTPQSERFADAEVGPETGENELTLRVSYDGGQVRYATPLPPDAGTAPAPSDGTSAAVATDIAPVGGGCIEWLEIDVTVTVETSGGALDETFETTLVATSTTAASFSKTLRFADLGGNLTVTPTEGSVSDVMIEGLVSSYGTRGTLSATVEASAGDGEDGATSGGYLALANWPADSVCGAGVGPALAVPNGMTWNGVTRADVTDLLVVDGPTTVNWSDDTTTELSVTAELADEACLVDGGDSVYVSYPATVTLATEDERLSATFDVFLTPIIEQDTLVSLQAFYGVGGEAAIEALGFSLEGHDDGNFNVDLNFGQEFSGAVTLSAYDTPVCDEVPTQDEGGGMSTGGCPGVEPETLLSGSWGTAALAPDAAESVEAREPAAPDAAK